jgi:hypothetical protein
MARPSGGLGHVLASRAMSEKRPCGKHLELASNASVKITQCSCGTVHLTMNASGVTVRINEETLKALTAGLIAATDKVTDTARPTIN